MIVLALAAALLAAAPAFAASDCILDNCAEKRPPRAAQPRPAPDEAQSPVEAEAAEEGPRGRFRPRGTTPSGDFDYYLLALSWSPSYCAQVGEGRSRHQCAPGANPGFVVHGLWPQYRGGPAPRCDGDGGLPYSVVVSLRDLFPEDGLARHEWRAHGACSGKSPSGYFADVRAARAAVTIPPDLKAPGADRELSPLDVQRAFVAANPRLRPGMMTVTCRGGVLQEARICLSKDLRDFVACPEVARRGCFSQSITVPAGR
jgi:ribonuclease T2